MLSIFTAVTDRSALAFELKPIRSVQSQAKNLVSPLDEDLSPSVVNLTFLYYRHRDT